MTHYTFPAFAFGYDQSHNGRAQQGPCRKLAKPANLAKQVTHYTFPAYAFGYGQSHNTRRAAGPL
ncbi:MULTISPECIES: hypothetical protein [Pseudomonas]|uniref:Uncharacterized protein n=1 Tax=Pseudomonas quercus TaxID=2722792 RepID=A0ABX0YK61_9PSED|nr:MULTISPECIES: hypothetical protein [Pseudomonas]MBF7144788.1 hypothetical protein [Pseudomonas sp. LY10J]NJP03325.1 hypothetical protein [Pseudomonas quercus]